MRRRYTTKIKKIMSYVFICGFAIGSFYSGTKVYYWMMDSNSTQQQVKNFDSDIQLMEKEDSENVELISQEIDIPKENPYWDYIKMNLIDVDFTELKKVNPSTAGWIQVSGTNINYPFVHTTDNKYMLLPVSRGP